MFYLNLKIYFYKKRVNAAVDLDGRGQSVTKNVMRVHGALIVSIVASVRRATRKRDTADHVHRDISVRDVANHVQVNGGEINVTKCVQQVLCPLKGKWDRYCSDFPF